MESACEIVVAKDAAKVQECDETIVWSGVYRDDDNDDDDGRGRLAGPHYSSFGSPYSPRPATPPVALLCGVSGPQTASSSRHLFATPRRSVKVKLTYWPEDYLHWLQVQTEDSEFCNGREEHPITIISGHWPVLVLVVQKVVLAQRNYPNLSPVSRTIVVANILANQTNRFVVVVLPSAAAHRPPQPGPPSI